MLRFNLWLPLAGAPFGGAKITHIMFSISFSLRLKKDQQTHGLSHFLFLMFFLFLVTLSNTLKQSIKVNMHDQNI